MPKNESSQVETSSGFHIGDVGRDLNVAVGRDWIGGDKIVNITRTTTIQISVDAVAQRPLVTASPYRGLDRFEDRDKDLFFGRDQLIARLLTQLNNTNLIFVLGASGSGKSSVVRAGLLPKLCGLLGARFRYFTLVPDTNPFDSLRSSFRSDFSESQTRDLADAQRGTPSRLIRALQREGDQWLIFIDQFEEIFTVSEERLRQDFIAALLEIARDTAVSTKLVLTMRADFLDRLSPFPEFAKLIEKNINLVTDMHADELRLAIEQPAARHGLVFEQGLVEEIIKDVQGQAGSLPLLQYTLDLVWEEERRTGGLDDRHLNSSTYRELGGVRGALQKRADEIYASFGDTVDSKDVSEKQEIVRRIFLRLVDIVGTSSGDAVWRPVRRRTPMAIFDTDQEQKVLRELINQKLVVSNRESAESTVEVAHEALFASWERLRNWIEGAKQVIFARNRLADDAHRWYRQQQENIGGAEEELLTGSRLGQVLEMRTRGDFLTLFGGLSEVETQFLEASTALRDRRKRQEQHRQQLELRRRIRVGVAIVGAFIVVGVLYMAISDAGLSVPFGTRIRSMFDRNELSVFRRIQPDSEIRRALVHTRDEFAAILAARRPGSDGMISVKPNFGGPLNLWAQSQTLYAAFVPGGLNDPMARAFLGGIDRLFAPGVLLEKDGVKYGWNADQTHSVGQAEPTLYTVAAAAAALRRPGFLASVERDKFESYLAQAVESTRVYYPVEDGGWNMYPTQTDPRRHNVYSTAIALLSLLELRRAGLGWNGSTEERDALLRGTAEWLMREYSRNVYPPGWEEGDDSVNPTIDGMTLQIYAELLRAEDEAGITISAEILRAIPRHVAQCATRDIGYGVQRAQFTTWVRDFEGREHAELESINTLWYPWAIDTSVRWLNRAKKFGAPRDDVIAVRRALGHLTVDLGDEAVNAAKSEWTFITAETLYVLALLPPF